MLPLLPILLAAALAAHRLGPLALAGGLALSFAVVGVFVASVGFALGLDATIFRNAAAVVLITFGLVLLSARLQESFAVAASGVSGVGQGLLSRLTIEGLGGQLLLGVLLGIVWSPCVGPTLGAAVTLASQGESLTQVTFLMLVFGLGAGAPLAALGFVSRSALPGVKQRLLAAGNAGKRVFGGILLVLGAAILAGFDKTFEAWVLDVAPPWFIGLTTRI